MIELVARFAGIEAVVLVACGLFLIFLDVNAPSDPSSLRRRLTEIWRSIAGRPAGEIPGFAISGAMRAVDRFVVYWFEQSERNAVTAGTFTSCWTSRTSARQSSCARPVRGSS